MQKKLTRSKSKRIIGGVAGGLGEHFNIDPIIFRIGFVLATIFHGAGLVIYIILWIIIPEDDNNTSNKDNFTFSSGEDKNTSGKESTMAQKNINGSSSGTFRIFAGVLLIGIGALFLFDKYIPQIDFFDIFPLFIILCGILLILNSIKKGL